MIKISGAVREENEPSFLDTYGPESRSFDQGIKIHLAVHR